ncbi:MAG: serine/threonine-protein kinase [Planctomycetota bacterium]
MSEPTEIVPDAEARQAAETELAATRVEDLSRLPMPDGARPPADQPSDSQPPDDGRLVAGLMIGGRYRVMSKIGAGAMGEVYRAEDLKLHQDVALKFLPAVFSRNEDRRRRFIDEVTNARKVSHPNVCRVHDLGEYDGRVFLSMEYVDGDDLSALLRRVGRLPEERALELARQLCAGIGAAHRAGVLHRDLKPGNVMIDGKGALKILDFGLAVATQRIKAPDVRAGTPAYMAPEQLAGTEVTERSDLYAMGLVLYQMFTGRQAFKANSVQDLRRRQEQSDIEDPSTLVENLDPVVGQVILRCLAPDPAKRPASAFEVARMLPGGDPLEAALAAGETPAPELVAASGRMGGAHGGLVFGLLAAILVTAGLVLMLQRSTSMIEVSPLEKSAPVLAYDAENMLAALGYTEAPRDRAYAFDFYEEYIREIRREDPSPERWGRLRNPRPAAIDFWYRQSPQVLRPNGPARRVSMTDPPYSTPGEIAVRLSPLGQLRELYVFSRSDNEAESAWSDASIEPDPAPLFAAADLDMAEFERVEPNRLPGISFDQRAAWTGVYPESPDVEIRVEVAWLGGLPVSFRVIENRWPVASLAAPDAGWIPNETARIASAAFQSVIVTAAGVMAFINFRKRRGDRKGAIRVGLVVMILDFIAGVLSAHLVWDAVQLVENLRTIAAMAVLHGFVIWLLYIAFEPYVRRIWPQTLISWSRLIEGRWRDPLVGDHVLIGVAVGCAAALFVTLAHFAWRITGSASAAPHVDTLGVLSLNGARQTFAAAAEVVPRSLLVAAPVIAGLVVLRLWLKKTWLAAGLFALVQSLVWSAQFEAWNVGALLLLLIIAGLIVFVAVRCGFLAVAVASGVYIALMRMPLTLEATWYTGASVVTLLALGAIAAFAANNSLRRTSSLRRSLA